MKILLIHPYVTSNNRFTVLTEPLGLISLASYVERSGHKVEILDLYALGINRIVKRGRFYTKGLTEESEILGRIREHAPELIGITCNFTEYSADAFELSKMIKAAIDLPIVIGGAHVSMDAEDTLVRNESIDVVVRGEGEVVFERLLNAIEKGETLDGVKGITYRNKEGKIVSTPGQSLMKEINTLPLADRSKIPLEVYLKNNTKSLQFVRKEPVATIMTSRGCPFNCVFCSTKVVWERRWRPLSAERVIEEIEMLVREYGVREIAIYDDQFIVNRERVERICNLLIEKKLNISLSIPSGTSVWLADEDLLKKMKKAGFYRLCFPIETGNEKTMKFIKKPINLERAKEMVRIANRVGLWTQGNFIIGFPYESKEEIESTIRYAYESGLDYAFFYIAKPYSGSEMYEIYKKENLLPEIARGSNLESTSYDTMTLKAVEIQKMRDSASTNYLPMKLLFYLNPVNFYNSLLPKLTTPGDIRYALKVFSKIVKKAFRDRGVAEQRLRIENREYVKY